LLFSFSKREIGQEQFEKVVNFTKQKIESWAKKFPLKTS
jgi:hypothetical protein